MELRIPKLGMEMTDGTIAEWLVDDGAVVAQDQPLYLLETDKVTNEVTAPIAGRLHRIGTQGESYEVGEHIADLDPT